VNNSSQNNFDLIRLFAASQVAVSHTAGYFGLGSPILSILSLFPGVPIFFFVSGYLIYGSYEQSSKNSNTNLNFFHKRFLRLYPALWLCFVISLISIWYSGYLSGVELSMLDFIAWTIAQNTIFQFYNPDFMRGYGVGVINGSLWTISVEIQFYLLTPFIFYLLKKFKFVSVLLVILILVFANVLNPSWNENLNIYQKFFGVSFVPWLYMFILGSLAYKYSSFLKILRGTHFLSILGLFIISYFLTKDIGWSNNINPISYLLMAATIMKIAYTKPHLSDTILKKNDISYGIYIFHMPIANYFLYQETVGIVGFIITAILTVIVAILSWFFYEKKFLLLKKSALRKNS
jgi:peptidoglycan/LPS O-acetylase OafA/YrhL